MNSINRFIGLRPSLFPDQQETQAKCEQTPTPVVSSGISGTPDAFETFQKGSLDLTPLTTPMASQNNESAAPNPTQGESVDASSFFDVLTADPGKTEAGKNASTTPDLGGLTQPMRDPGEGSIASALSPNASDKATATVVDTANLTDAFNEPDGDMIEMMFGWAQINLGVDRSGAGTWPDEGSQRSEDQKKTEDESNDQGYNPNDDRSLSSEDADLGMGFYDRPGDDSGGGGGRNKVVAGIIGPRMNRPDPDGGGEEPKAPGPGKKAPGGSGSDDDDDEGTSSGSSVGNYPFVGEGDTVIHPQVNVASESVSGSIDSDFTNAGYTPDPDDGDPTPPPVINENP